MILKKKLQKKKGTAMATSLDLTLNQVTTVGTPPPTPTLGHLGGIQHILTLLGLGMPIQDMLGMGMLGIQMLGLGILASMDTMDTTQQILGTHIILDRLEK